MSSRFRRSVEMVANLATWGSTILLTILPLIIAIDFGGILWWTQSASAYVVVAAIVLAIPSLLTSDNPKHLRQHLILIPLVFWIGFAMFQTFSMQDQLVRKLSPASYSAYTEWIKPFLSDANQPSFFPISLSSEQSRHAVALLAMVLGTAWAASQVFLTRARISFLLNVLSLGIAAHAIFGVMRVAFPQLNVLGIELTGNGFGTFVNRNNAALMMNLGLATSLGLLSWRLSALTGLEVDDPTFEFNDLVSLVSDRDSVLGCLGVVGCITGLLVCGSRGGLVACLVGFLMALGWVRQKRGLKTIPVIVAAIAVAVAFLVVPLKLNLESIRRLEMFSNDQSETFLEDGRWEHWQDGWQTALDHLPAGSGLGTYGYAYLPHQEHSSGSWHIHADNLWLELFVEQGIFGILMTLALFAIFTITLLRMGHSPDPIDQGLRTAGWYLLGAMIAAEFFDFGLILPANFLIVTTLVAVTVARGAVIRINEGRIRFRSRGQTALCFLVAVSILLQTLVALAYLQSDAQVEYLAKSADSRIEYDPDKAVPIGELQSEIQAHPRYDDSPMLKMANVKLTHQLARLEEFQKARPRFVEEMREAYEQTTLTQRRKRWWKLRQDNKETLEQGKYGKALKLTEELFALQPLDSQVRTWEIYLDFVHQDRTRTLTAIEQIQSMHPRHASTLALLGGYAADCGAMDEAVKLWHAALKASPSATIQVLELAEAFDGVSLEEVLPSDPTVFRTFARRTLNSEDAPLDLLVKAKEEIRCDQCTSKSEKASCLELQGDIDFRLGNLDDSFNLYENAVKLVPTNKPLQLKFIRRLRDSGKRRAALFAARRARLVIPDDTRFTRMIEEMAASDLMEVEGNVDQEGSRSSNGVPRPNQ